MTSLNKEGVTRMGKQKMTVKRKKNLRALARLMNKQNVASIPVIQPLLDCFDLVITPEENDFLLRMGTEPLTYEQAASFSELPEESFRPFLEGMLKKGLVWSEFTDEGEELYVLAPILVGWFEIYLSDGNESPAKQEFARCVDKLFKSWGKLNVFPLRTLMNYQAKKSHPHWRTAVTKKSNESAQTVEVEVNKQLMVSGAKIYPTRSVYELIEKYGDKNQIVLVHCFCRQWRKMVGEVCRFDQPYESCIALGKITKYAVKYGIGRYISKKEALRLVGELQEKGAVHQVFHEREDLRQPELAICNCCWDCCGILGSYNRGILPLRIRAYYYAQIEDDTPCTGCGTCVKYCPVQAVSVVDKKSRIIVEKCIGCGQCELQCPENVISLVYREREVFLPLPKKTEARLALSES
jgi:ferredoxin